MMRFIVNNNELFVNSQSEVFPVVLQSRSMNEFATLRLRKNEDKRLRTGHNWIFSNEVDTAATPLKGLQAGAPTLIENHQGKAIGTGYVNPNALICARLVSRNPDHPFGPGLFVHRFKVALSLRERLFPEPFYRLVHGDSDGLPGLVVDQYGDIVVVQIATAGMERMKETLVAALEKVLKPKVIVFRNDGAFRRLEHLDEYTEATGDSGGSVELTENGVRFRADVMQGQKTGWFYDQRDNRAKAARYAQGARVLDLFSFSGGFGIQAAKAGATDVLCVDSSGPALEQIQAHAEINGVADRVQTRQGDAFDVLKALREEEERFDLVMVDPPAFIRRKKDIAAGETAYRRINQAAMQVLGRDGILVSSSCSYHLPRFGLQRILNQSARHLDRNLQILEHGHQGRDHPIHPAIAETEYLKTLIGRVVYG